MKIKTIKVENFKAISEEVADFNGCSAIITAGNRQGKSSLLKGLIDRFQGEIPSKIVKTGESKGFNRIELTDGAVIEWKFTEKTESFSFTTSEGVKMTQGVIKGIGKKYFGEKFDIDAFVNSSAKEQEKVLARLLGLDFLVIDEKIKKTYSERTDATRELNRIISEKKSDPTIVVKPDLDAANNRLSKIKRVNKKLKDRFECRNKDFQEKIVEFNNEQIEIRNNRKIIEDSYVLFCKHDIGLWSECIDFEKAKRIHDKRLFEKDTRPLSSLPEPTYFKTDSVENALTEMHKQEVLFAVYEKEKESFENWVIQGTEARKKVSECETNLTAARKEKTDAIAKASIPEGFEFSEDGLLYNGFQLKDSSISSSEKYIAGLKLGMIGLGLLDTMHFDASFLDRNSLAEVQEFADSKGIQLLIERPDFEGADTIKYEIL